MPNSSVCTNPKLLRLLATGTLNSSSSGSPASAGRRNRTASTSTQMAISVTPPTVMNSTGLVVGIGGENLNMELA